MHVLRSKKNRETRERLSVFLETAAFDIQRVGGGFCPGGKHLEKTNASRS